MRKCLLENIRFHTVACRAHWFTVWSPRRQWNVTNTRSIIIHNSTITPNNKTNDLKKAPFTWRYLFIKILGLRDAKWQHIMHEVWCITEFRVPQEKKLRRWKLPNTPIVIVQYLVHSLGQGTYIVGRELMKILHSQRKWSSLGKIPKIVADRCLSSKMPSCLQLTKMWWFKEFKCDRSPHVSLPKRRWKTARDA